MFHSPAAFAFATAFEENWQAIRDEFLALDRKILDIHRSGSHEKYLLKLLRNNGWIPSWQVGKDGADGKSSDANYQWLTYGLSYGGLFPEEAPQKYPRTMALLKRLKGFKVCAFSLMRPMSFIGPHTHPELGGDLLTFHLGIQTDPQRSYLCVDGEFREEKAGSSMVFDGSHEHFAINMSERDRVILYMEFDKSKLAFA